MIRELELRDIAACSQRHLDCMERSANTVCGAEWMAHIYEMVCKSSVAFGYVVDIPGEGPVAAVTGVLDSSRFMKEVLTEAFASPSKGARLLGGAILNPCTFLHDVLVGRYSAALPQTKDAVYLSSIWTQENQRGKGWGSKLIEALKEKGKSAGKSHFYLHCTKENVKADQFYRNLGCEGIGECRGVTVYLSK